MLAFLAGGLGVLFLAVPALFPGELPMSVPPPDLGLAELPRAAPPPPPAPLPIRAERTPPPADPISTRGRPPVEIPAPELDPPPAEAWPDRETEILVAGRAISDDGSLARGVPLVVRVHGAVQYLDERDLSTTTDAYGGFVVRCELEGYAGLELDATGEWTADPPVPFEPGERFLEVVVVRTQPRAVDVGAAVAAPPAEREAMVQPPSVILPRIALADSEAVRLADPLRVDVTLPTDLPAAPAGAELAVALRWVAVAGTSTADGPPPRTRRRRRVEFMSPLLAGAPSVSIEVREAGLYAVGIRIAHGDRRTTVVGSSYLDVPQEGAEGALETGLGLRAFDVRRTLDDLFGEQR